MDSQIENRASSIRSRAPRATLELAKRWANKAGISEVTDITHLDCLGVPVYISVRPDSRADKYTYGKGIVAIDAEVGAYMEAIEYFFAEPDENVVKAHWGTPRDVAGSEQSAHAVLDYVPLFDREIDLDGPLRLVHAEDIETGKQVSIPAELVYRPAPDIGQTIYSTSTNGLASGNSVLEATVHALTELIERDIWSFEFVRNASRLIEPKSLPDNIRKILDKAERGGLRLIVRSIPNEYGMPFFVAFLFNPNTPVRKFFNGGWGCHLDRSIAVTRAVTEATQSRLAYIHGGRGEPAMPSPLFPREGDETETVQRHMHSVQDANAALPYDDVIDLGQSNSLNEKLSDLITRVREVTNKPIYRCVYTPADSPLHVVRLVAPLLEDFKAAKVRVGHRLKAAIDAAR